MLVLAVVVSEEMVGYLYIEDMEKQIRQGGFGGTGTYDKTDTILWGRGGVFDDDDM